MKQTTILLFIGLAIGSLLLLLRRRKEKRTDAELSAFFAERTARRQREAEQRRQG